MARLPILEFEISLHVESKLGAHRIARRQIDEILRNKWVVVRNRKNRAADYVVIGWDDNRRCIAVPVLPTENPSIWRPVTAWYCKSSEEARLR